EPPRAARGARDRGPPGQPRGSAAAGRSPRRRGGGRRVKLKFTLRRPAGPVDLVVTADGTSTVGDVARTLAAADPAGSGTAPERLTIAVLEADGGRVLDPARAVGESGIRSGTTLQVTRAPDV